MKIVPIEDRDILIEEIRIILNSCELYVSYEQCDLIYKVMFLHTQDDKEITLKDIFKLNKSWKEEWENYWKEKNKIETTTK